VVLVILAVLFMYYTAFDPIKENQTTVSQQTNEHSLYAGISAEIVKWMAVEEGDDEAKLPDVKKLENNFVVASPMLDYDLMTYDNAVLLGGQQNLEVEVLDIGLVEETESVVDEVEEEPEPEPEPIVYEYKYEYVGYISPTNLNVREEPNTESDVLGTLGFNSEVKYSYYENDTSNEWGVIKYDGKEAFIYLKYIADSAVEYKSMAVSGDKRKSYMDWTAITSKTSKQYKLQANYATTASNGVRTVNGRYCIALGSYYTHDVGRYVDVVLENGTILPCIIGDCKRDRDTINNCSLGIDGGVAEFIVSTSALSSTVRKYGDVSYSYDSWMSNAVEIRIYDKNIFD
jgi:uncharacterized protein YgiM (DUF1202 family)